MQANLHTNGLSDYAIPGRVLFGRSKAMDEIQKTVERVAEIPVPVLLQGEKGTGKELVGREIHRRSPWHDHRFVKVLSRRMTPRTLAGLSAWEDDEAGTVFMYEIGELNAPMQARLLELFQSDSQSNRDSRAPRHLNQRVICSTRRNLTNDIAAGTFRSDLFYRINIVSIQLPKLADRKEDIPALTEYFVETYSRQQNRCCHPMSSETLQAFCDYEWPGNIRELAAFAKRYVDMDGGAHAGKELFPRKRSVSRSSPKERPDTQLNTVVPLKDYTRQIVGRAERDLMLTVLREHRWNRKEAAQALQISYGTLLQKLKKAGLVKKQEPGALGSSKAIFEEQLP